MTRTRRGPVFKYGLFSLSMLFVAYVAHLKGVWAHIGFGQETHTVLMFKTGEVVGFPSSRERCEKIQDGLKPGFYVIATETETGRKERVEKAWCVPPAVAGAVSSIARALHR